MKGESLSLLNRLTLRLGTARPVSRIDPPNASVPFLERYHVIAPEDRRPQRRSSSTAVALLGAAWCTQVARYFDYDFLPLHSAILAALITFACSWLLAYAVWVRLLHRKSDNLVLAAAALSLFWCATGLLFPVLRF